MRFLMMTKEHHTMAKADLTTEQKRYEKSLVAAYKLIEHFRVALLDNDHFDAARQADNLADLFQSTARLLRHRGLHTGS